MTFKRGKSGNPSGRPKGAVSKRVQLAKLLEPHAASLVDKAIELALGGDTNALRLCVERLIPKIKQEPMVVELPETFTKENIEPLKKEILRAVFSGQINVTEAEAFIRLIDSRINGQKTASIDSIPFPNDPVEASRLYQELIK